MTPNTYNPFTGLETTQQIVEQVGFEMNKGYLSPENQRICNLAVAALHALTDSGARGALGRVRNAIIDRPTPYATAHHGDAIGDVGSVCISERGRVLEIIDRELAALPPTATVAQPVEPSAAGSRDCGKRLRECLSAAPEAAKADEVAEPANTAEFDGYAEGAKILKGCIANHSIEQARAVGIALRQWHDKWVGAVDAIGSNAKQMQEKDAEVAELRAKLEATEKREAAGVALFDGIVAELRRDLTSARADVARLTETWDHIRDNYVDGDKAGDHESVRQCVDRMARDLAAARADQRAVAVEELRHLRSFSLGQDARAICTLMDKRIAALTAPAAEPNPSETPNSSPAQGGDGDAVLRKWLALNKSLTPTEWLAAMSIAVDELSRRALEGK